MKKDKVEYVLDLTEMLENELKTTYEGIENGKDWQDYMRTSLDAYYQFIEWYRCSEWFCCVCC